MMKCLADIIVVLGCGYVGAVFASHIDIRVRQLETLEAVLTRLGFNIEFLSLPFAEALQRASREPDAVCRLLENAAERMQKNPGLLPDRAFEEAMHRFGRSLCLKQPELDALRELLTYAGRGDEANTMNSIRLTAAKLQLAREDALALRSRDGKLYRGLGFLAGMLIVVLLV